MTKTKAANKVQFETARIVARAQAKVTIQKSLGSKAQILQNANAVAAVTQAYVEAEKEAYGKVHTDLEHGECLLSERGQSTNCRLRTFWRLPRMSSRKQTGGPWRRGTRAATYSQQGSAGIRLF